MISGFNQVIAKKNEAKPRVIVMTDGEIDDRSSMIRFLLYTCDFDVEAIIETNSIFQRKGHSKEDWYEKQLNAYQEIYPNLIRHNNDYPTPQKLREVSFVGDEDESHVKDLYWKNMFEVLVPGSNVIYKPDHWADTPGSDKILEVLLEDNPAPVYIQAWGGANTAARAFYKLKTEYPDDYEKAISKVVMYNIWYQDGAGIYIENDHPKVTMLYSSSFKGTWDYNSQKDTYGFIETHVKNNHGPLGGVYPQDYVSEGDTPAFLYCVGNGLRNHESPAYGGWGGRFKKFNKFDNVYVDAEDDGDNKKSLRRWIDDANRDFQARMDWCVASTYEDANHAPKIIVKGKEDKTVKRGKKIKLDASKSSDPDGNDIHYDWWQYKEAGSYDGLVDLQDSKEAGLCFIAPEVRKPETIHMIIKIRSHPG